MSYKDKNNIVQSTEIPSTSSDKLLEEEYSFSEEAVDLTKEKWEVLKNGHEGRKEIPNWEEGNFYTIGYVTDLIEERVEYTRGGIPVPYDNIYDSVPTEGDEEGKYVNPERMEEATLLPRKRRNTYHSFDDDRNRAFTYGTRLVAVTKPVRLVTERTKRHTKLTDDPIEKKLTVETTDYQSEYRVDQFSGDYIKDKVANEKTPPARNSFNFARGARCFNKYEDRTPLVEQNDVKLLYDQPIALSEVRVKHRTAGVSSVGDSGFIQGVSDNGYLINDNSGLKRVDRSSIYEILPPLPQEPMLEPYEFFPPVPEEKQNVFEQTKGWFKNLFAF